MFRQSSKLFAPLVLLLAGAISMGQSTPPAANGGPPPTKLAVVNIIQLFDSLDERADGESQISKMKDAFTAELKKRQDEVDDLKKEITNPMFKPNSEEFRKAQDDLLDKTFSLQSATQSNQQKLFLEQRLRTVALYRKMNDAIAAYSQANGIALVFCADNLDLSNAGSQQELQAMVTVRKLLYYHSSFDITKYIIEKMNTEYKLGARK